MKKLLILLMVFVPLLQLTSFAQDPRPAFQIIGFSLQDQEGNPVKLIDNDYALLSKDQTYQVKVTLKNISEKKYNDPIRLELLDSEDIESRIEVLEEINVLVNKNQIASLVFNIEYNKIKTIIKPIIYSMQVTCKNYLSSDPFIRVEPIIINNQQIGGSRRVIIGEDNFSIYKEQREIINRKLEEMQKKRIEKESN